MSTKKSKNKTKKNINIKNISTVPIPDCIKESLKVEKAKRIFPYLFFINKFFLIFTSITCIYIIYIFISLPAPTLLVSFEGGDMLCSNKYYNPKHNSIDDRETDYYENFCSFLEERGKN